MPMESGDNDREELVELVRLWEEFDNTGDESLLVDVLADDVVLLPPENPPIVGKSAVVELLREFPEEAYDVEQTAEKILVGDELAVVWSSVTGETVVQENEQPEEVSHKAIDVYRRSDGGGWKCCFSIWNDHA